MLLKKFFDSQNVKNERVVLSFFFVGLVLFDQAAKLLLFQKSLYVVYPFLGIESFKNYNFAFSLVLPPELMYVLYGLILFGIMVYLSRHWISLTGWQKCAWVSILAGAVSNIGERIVLGYVRDFIHVLWGYFNVADVFIVVGIVILVFFKPHFSQPQIHR